MSAGRDFVSLCCRTVVALILLTGLILPIIASDSAVASVTRVIPTCSARQLEVAVAWGPDAAAGHIGVPFIIVNTSRTACSLKGYPKLTFSPSTYKGKSVITVDGGGMVYPPVSAQLVVIKPGAVASFGLNYTDVLNQQDPYGAACTARFAYITLPVKSDTFSKNFQTTMDFNFCYSGFAVSVTSIQARPVPKRG